MRVLLSCSPSTTSHAALTLPRVASGSGVPMVVEAVTVTTMMVADGRIPLRSTSDMSISFPSLRTTRA